MDDDTALTSEQMFFFLEHHNMIMEALNYDNREALLKLASGTAYHAVFGDMSWDEAYSKYERFLDDED
jgi:hypothetical protein